MKPYHYKSRQGIREITWGKFHQMCGELAQRVCQDDFDIVIGIARGGLYAGTLISGMIRKEFYPIRITRRENDRIKFEKPIWKIDVPDEVKDKKVLIVDEICDSGETLSIVSSRVKEKGAKSIKTVALIIHSWANPKPDCFIFESDELVIFPWDRQILVDGKWELHPELAFAMKLQRNKDETI